MLSGRSRERLDAVAERIGSAGGDAVVVPLDVSDGEAVPAARDAVLAAAGRIDALVLSAGLNSPRRTWGTSG